LSATKQVSIGSAIESLVKADLPIRLTAYDGSAAGPPDAAIGLHLRDERGLAYLVTAPGDLGFARAYVSGDLEVSGVHPGNPYDAMAELQSNLAFRWPHAHEVVRLVRGLGPSTLKPPPPPPQEHLPPWRRAMEGLRHSMTRDAEAIQHHYDVSNKFYELVLGPSMAYSCAVFEDDTKTLEEAQTEKFDLICRKLRLRPGQRFLDIGCGWGGLIRHAAREYGVRALGVTLSREQATWAQTAVDGEGLRDLVEVRHVDYRDVGESGFDAIASVGMMEHVGVRSYPSYFSFMRDHLTPGGRLLNHCITRSHNRRTRTGAFIDRYVFPDGELTGSGTIVAAAQDAGLEVQHTENLRPHYARTLAGWSTNLEANWDACVDEVGVGTSRVWGIYMAGSRIAFERGELELHQVLATRADDEGASFFPLRPDWRA
jgi:cyclopropane-fatty-acyl-phospholipid synthase